MDAKDLLEENLFQSEGNALDNLQEDDDDSLLNEMNLENNSLLSDDDGGEEEEEEEDFSGKKDDSLFSEEEEDDDDDNDEESEFSDKELDALNKKLGTDFKSIDDLKKGFKKEESKSEEEAEAIEYKVLKNKSTQFDRFIQMDNESLVREQLFSQAAAAKKDINSEEVKDEIEEKIEGLKDLDTLDTMADNLRTSLKSLKDQADNSIKKIDDKNTKKIEDQAKQNVESLQNAFSQIFEKKEFMGVTLSKEVVNEVYKNVRSNKFFESVNNDQEMIAKVAMFVHLENEIQKRTNEPTQSDRTRSAFNTLANNGKGKARTLASAKGSAASDDMDNVMAFIK